MVVISVSVHEGPCERHEGLPECHQDGPHLLPGLLQCRQCVLPHTALQTGQPNYHNHFFILHVFLYWSLFVVFLILFQWYMYYDGFEVNKYFTVVFP